MLAPFQSHLQQQIEDIRAAGAYKRERVIVTPQGTSIRVADGQPADLPPRRARNSETDSTIDL